MRRHRLRQYNPPDLTPAEAVMSVHIYLCAPGEPRRPPPGMDAVIHLDEPGRSGYPLHHHLARLPAPAGPSGQETLAFLLTALGVWAADKLLPRRAAPDAWTRRITLHLPLSPGWVPLAPRLARLLDFLTGDLWTLAARAERLDLGLSQDRPLPWRPDGVLLFSGGLNSLVGALDFLDDGGRLLLVSHYDYGQLAAVQQHLAAALLRQYGAHRVQHLGLRVQFPQGPELSQRSRSLLYLALGLTAAAAGGPATPLIIPENGWISLNPPLTLNRLGSLSTRTTHPHFLARLTALWREAGLAHPLINPYQDLTKGEMLRRCRNPAGLRQVFAQTISCARPVVARWQGGAAGACGYCYPCLMRRVALHAVGWDRGEDYRRNALANPQNMTHRVRGQDLRALLLALQTWEERPAEMMARLTLGDPATMPARFRQSQQVLAQGFQEIGDFFRQPERPWIKAYRAGRGSA